MPHYYTPHPTSEHDIKLIQATLRGLSLRFFTDSGVFSKDGVDYGTQALIAAMRIPAGAAVLDMGCGYGPLGITAALLNPTGSVTFADINARALDLAAKNCAANGVTNARFVLSDGFGALEHDKFDCILLNPPIRAGKDVVFRLYRGAARHIKPCGSLWVVIQKKQGAPSTAKELALLFSAVHIRDRDKGYYVFEAEAEAKGTEPIASQPPTC
ncbi:MAG: class I SAM-dependent methyltransferase [Selenomonadales bacterium]|jgi:16S rRNA (guanine1207-N2)-methyltransferase|nr:class I SAM-dependent methyltransferase [Selenomonadales bacterium]